MEAVELPVGWSRARVGEVATLFRGVTYSKDQALTAPQVGMKPILRGNNINGELNFDDLVYVPEALIAQEQLISTGDIIFAMSSGSKHLVGKSAKARISFDGGFGAFCGLVRATEAINQDFLHYVFQGSDFRRAISEVSKGSNINNLKREHILDFEFSCPPLAEQHRIVAKIEELFSELDQGVASLKTAREQLKVYRQSLLKNAFEGKLTAAWRAAHRDQLETAAALQQRIARERQTHHQQQLADWQTAGQAGPKPKPPKPLPPLTAEELAELPELPAGWVWMKYGDMCSLVRNGISAKPEGDSGTPIFRISAVRPMCFDMADIRYIDNSSGEFDTYRLERGDLVFTRYNGSRQYVGVCAEYRSDEKCLFPDKLVQTRVFSKLLLTSFLEKALNSGASRAFVESKIRTTAGQSGVSGEDIKNIPVPVCCLEEQLEIVQELESKLSEADQLDQTLASALQQADALRQSILKKAFCGALLPQDKNDEPAAALLERIRAGKSNGMKIPVKRGKAG